MTDITAEQHVDCNDMMTGHWKHSYNIMI